eukprot:TRINITY_DN17183_c1_g1_i1.p1 TRINITY_DN17183_c1_g1~~TRINITY_DN17183_c1_g1_i1.p1  ORF type:complete len:544 (-),score=142.82 TRINITY_DN17183_c1_g1_i1:263-1894(-)
MAGIPGVPSGMETCASELQGLMNRHRMELTGYVEDRCAALTSEISELLQARTAGPADGHVVTASPAPPSPAWSCPQKQESLGYIGVVPTKSDGTVTQLSVPGTQVPRKSLLASGAGKGDGKACSALVVELENVLGHKGAESVNEASFLDKMVRSHHFDMAVAGLITVNFLVMYIESDTSGYHSRVSLGLADPGNEGVATAEFWFAVLEHIFTVFYIMELVVRFWAGGFTYVKQNAFDVAIIVWTTLDLYLLSGLINMQALKVIRVVRVLRVMRLCSLFRDLRILLKTVFASLKYLWWSMVLLMIVIVVFGLIMAQLLTTFVMDETQAHDVRMWTYTKYGTATRATWTAYAVVMSGCWPNYAHVLAEEVSPVYAIIYVCYSSVIVFGVVSIIRAILLRETMQAASTQGDELAQEQMRKRASTAQKLLNFFVQHDESGDGLIDFHEFQRLLQNQSARGWLQSLDLDVQNAERLFHMLDSGGDGTLDTDELVNGIMHLKGYARSLDLFSAKAELRKEVRLVLSRLEQGLNLPHRPLASHHSNYSVA